MSLTAPFPWFGGKSRVASTVWQRFGNVRNYVEPFFGSGAVLLARPRPFDGVETVNDKDGFVANFWRAVQAAPESVARFAEWPVNENDLHARHVWLVERKEKLQARLEGDPDFYDARIAGYWVWGVSTWIGGGFCSGDGPWSSVDVDGFRQLERAANPGHQVMRRRPSSALMGVNAIGRNEAAISDGGVVGRLVRLCERLRRVSVLCGDWTRLVTDASTVFHGVTAVFLDPPYSDRADNKDGFYAQDSLSVAGDVLSWAIANGRNPMLRIALCGYEGDYSMPVDWTQFSWSAVGGYGNRKGQGAKNRHRERVWFSPHCQKPDDAQPMLWEDEA